MKAEGRKNQRRLAAFDALICLGAAALIAVIFATGLLNTQKVWPDVSFDHAKGNASYILAEGDGYGVKATSTSLNLDAGTYRLRWQINGDGANAIRLGRVAGGEISPLVIHTAPGEWQGEAFFEIKEPVHHFFMQIEFSEGTWMEIYNVRLYTPEYTDGAWIASAVILALLVLWMLRRHGKWTAQHTQTLCVLGFAVALMTIPALCRDVYCGSDTAFHAPRLMNLADSLRSGQFPARLGGFTYNGYGAVTSVFYPDRLLYPFAGMIIGGASLTLAYNAVWVAVLIAAALSMYMASKQLFGNHEAALCAAVLYVCTPFMVKSVYIGNMQGQALAMAVMPQLMLGIWEVIRGDEQRWPLLAFSATLVFQSHMLSAVICAVFACVMGVLCLPGILREGRLVPIVKAIVSALLLNLFALVPLVTMYLDGVTTSPNAWFPFADTALKIKEILSPDQWIGLPVLLGVAALWMHEVPQTRESRTAKAFGVVGCLLALACTELVPWQHVSVLTGGIVSVIQFPWRILILAVPLLCLCAGYGYMSVAGDRRNAAVLCVLGLAAVVIWPVLDDYMSRADILEFGTSASPYVMYQEYQIEGTDLGATWNREPLISGDVQLMQYEKNGTAIRAEVSAEEGGAVEFPLFAFEGYRAELDGREAAISRGSNNRIHIDVPAGTNGMLSVRFVGKALWRIADAVSLLTAVGLCAYMIGRRRIRLDA